MFSNWKEKLASIGGFIGFVLGVLAFLEINAKQVWEAMTAHYLWLIGAVASLVVCAWGSYRWWKSSRVTVENARPKIRQWLDQHNTDHGVTALPFDDWLWGLRVPLRNGPLLFIAYTAGRPDSILFRGGITALTPELRATYDKLSEQEKNKLFYKLRLDASRARFFFLPGPETGLGHFRSLDSNPLVNSLHFYRHRQSDVFFSEYSMEHNLA